MAFLQGVFGDAEYWLEIAGDALGGIPVDDPERQRLRESTVLLSQLLKQDVGRQVAGVSRRPVVTPARTASLRDPQMRYGYKRATDAAMDTRQRL